MKAKMLAIVVLVPAVMLVLFGSCGKSANTNRTETENPRTVLTSSGVSVRIYDESGTIVEDPGTAVRLTVTSTAAGREAIVALQTATTLRTSYVELKFAKAHEHPTEIQCGTALLEHSPLVYLGTPEAGTVICAQVIPGEKAYQVNGSLLRVKLERGAHQVRSVSDFNQDPVSDPIIADPIADKVTAGKVSWTYKLRGEANGNQVFDFADFGEVGAKYNKTVGTTPSCEPADGNKNTKVDFADFGVIGANYNRGIGGLKAFRDDTADPTTSLGLLDTSGFIKGDFTIDKAANKTLSNGFKQFWHTFGGSGKNLKIILLDKAGAEVLGQVRIVEVTGGGGGTPTVNPPTGVKASDGLYPDRVSLTWAAPTTGDYPDGYKIYRSNTATGTYSQIGTVGSVTSYDDTSLTDTNTYYYKVSSTLGALESAMSTEDAGALDKTPATIEPAKDVTASSTFPDKVVVFWNPPDTGDAPDGYKIYRSIAATGPYTYIGTVGATSTYEDKAVPSYKLYYYKVASTLGADESALSTSYGIGSKLATGPTLNPPTGITASDGVFPGKVAISWTAPSSGEKPDGYKVYRSTTATGTYTNIGTAVGVTTFDDTAVPDTSVYYYKVSSVKSTYESTLSTEDAGSKKVPTIVINPPTIVKATDGIHADKVVVTWTAPTTGDKPDGYKIYRATTIDGTYSNLGAVGAVTSYEDTTAKNMSLYYYVVTSTKGSDESIFSKADLGFIIMVNNRGDNWMFGREQTHSRRSMYIGPTDWKTRWTYTTGSDVWSTASFDKNGNLYFGCSDNKLYALKGNGTLLWTYDTGATIFCSPAIDPDGNIYFGNLAGTFYSLKADGSLNWTFTAGPWVVSSPAIGEDGTVYFASYDTYVYALNPDGTEKWKYNTGALIDSSPAIGVDGTIYIGAYDDKLYAFNPDGTVKWTFLTGGDINSCPAIGSDGTIYVGSDDNYLWAISSAGKEVWKFATGDDVFASPAIATNGYIVVGSHDNYLYCIDSTGKEVWKYPNLDDLTSSPTIDAENNVYFTERAGWTISVELMTGSANWMWEHQTTTNSSPVLAPDGSVVVGTGDKKIISIGPGTGKPDLNPPDNIKATLDVHAGKVVLTWDNPSLGAVPDGYYIYRSLSNQPTAVYQYIGSALSIGSYTDSAVTAGVTYYYKLVSHKASMKYNDSGMSNPPATGRAL